MQNRTTLESLKTKLRKLIKAESFNMHDFWISCGFTYDELRSSTRKREIKSARQVGITWAVMSGMTLSDAGSLFCKDHSVAWHSLNVVIIALEMPKQYPDISRVVDRVTYGSNRYRMSVSRDNHTAMLVSLENIMSQLQPGIFKN